MIEVKVSPKKKMQKNEIEDADDTRFHNISFLVRMIVFFLSEFVRKADGSRIIKEQVQKNFE